MKVQFSKKVLVDLTSSKWQFSNRESSNFTDLISIFANLNREFVTLNTCACAAGHGGVNKTILVMDVLSLAVDLIDQREIEVKAFHTFSMKHFHLGLVLFILHVFDHVREPHSQTVVADEHSNQKALSNSKKNKQTWR